MEIITAFAVGLLFAIGVFQTLRRNILRSAIGLVLLANAINLFLLSSGAYNGIGPAYVNETSNVRSDALPQALILTAIVISMGGTAFVLAMINIISTRYKTRDMDEVNGLKN